MKTKYSILNNFLAVVFVLITTLVFTSCESPDNNSGSGNNTNIPPQWRGAPTIRIDTNNVPIANRTTWVTMTFSMTDPSDPSNNILPITEQQIRGRGNSSWSYTPGAKNPYRIRFRSDRQQSPFGLRAARNWVLLKDGTDVNTSFGFELGKRLGLQYTCTYHHVHLYLNGDYRGMYLFTEHRQADPNEEGVPGRPRADLLEGWFVEVDRYFDTSADRGDPGFRTANYFNLPVLIKSPDFSSQFPQNGVIPDSVNNFVRNDWNELTNLMASDSFPENGYRDLVDIDTFVKYFIVQTVIMNNDLFRPRAETGEEIGSTFFYKDKDGLISAGPLWDLNWTFAPWAFEGREFLPDKFPYQIHNWFRRFHEDPVFHVRYKEVWNKNYQNNILTMLDFIDDLAGKIKNDVLKDLERWSRSPYHQDWHIEHVKDYFSKRAAFLHAEYNKVDVIPASRDFRPANAASAQTITLVAFGQMTGLSATLQRGSNSAFEIVTQLNQTPSRDGDGGYLASISVRPKASRPAGSHTDVLVLSGTNQGRSFTHNVSLNFTP